MAGRDHPDAMPDQAQAEGHPDVVRVLNSAGADTVYFHLYDVADLDHVRLLGREVLPRLD